MRPLQKNNAPLLPVCGFILFVILYVIAAVIYPGGSEINRSATHFSLTENFWCDLLERHAENGMPNTARSTAIIAMVVLCVSIMGFWYFVPRLFRTKDWIKVMVRTSGLVSMLILSFLRDDAHDLTINWSLAFGAIALTGCFYGLWTSGFYALMIFGIFCLGLSVGNAYIYYTGNWFDYLAIIQKFSFGAFLLWFSLVLFQVKARHR